MNVYGAFSGPRITPSAYKLKIELIPAKLWGVNLRAMMSAHQWGKIRKAEYERSGGVCEICQGAGWSGRLECHEVWSYNEERRLQTLEGLAALCPLCHQVKHLGFADKQGKLEECLEHMAKVNGMTMKEAEAYVEWSYKRQQRRARMRWTTDLSWFEARYPGVIKAPQAD